jgi:Secretion system C-terminal sorting domain
MKKALSVLIGLFFLLTGWSVGAQTFSIASDTIWYTPTLASTVIYNRITNITNSPISLKWSVVGTDFPADWFASAGGSSTSFCDNTVCYYNSIFNTGSTQVTGTYAAGATGDFHMVLNLSGATTGGTHFMTIRLVNANDTAFETFIVTYPTAVVPTVKNADEVILYPNPAINEVNIVYDANADVKTVAIYNLIGKMMQIYKVSGNSANLNIESMPSGIYFVRLMNAHGDVVLTRKFNKE